jgi:hypothetical protein
MRFRPNTLLRAAIFLGTMITVSLGNLAIGQVSASGSRQGSVASTLPTAGPGRPGNVPEGYRITPLGYFHPSCVQSLTKGERLLADGRVQQADGSIQGKALTCMYPHYTRTGIVINASSAKTGASQSSNTQTNPTPELSGWLESASVVAGSSSKSYGALIATWTVPAQPSTDDGQVLFFFPGLEDINDTQSILQPVLQWSHGQWGIASWNCCMNGVIAESPVVNVSSGDRIYGSITSTCPQGTLSCATWNVLSLDLSTGESTTLGDTPSEGQIFNWAFGGVLEPYYVVTCDDLPKDRRISFDDITIFDENLQVVRNVDWSEAGNTEATPQCGYKVKAMQDKVTLEY